MDWLTGFWRVLCPAFAAIGFVAIVGWPFGFVELADWNAPMILALPFLAVLLDRFWIESYWPCVTVRDGR